LYTHIRLAQSTELSLKRNDQFTVRSARYTISRTTPRTRLVAGAQDLSPPRRGSACGDRVSSPTPTLPPSSVQPGALAASRNNPIKIIELIGIHHRRSPMSPLIWTILNAKGLTRDSAKP